jgi:hypothetical protein
MDMEWRHHNRTIVSGVRVVLREGAAQDGALRAGELGVVEGLDETATGDVVAVVRTVDPLAVTPLCCAPSAPVSLRQHSSYVAAVAASSH